jgi:hypothetical protein
MRVFWTTLLLLFFPWNSIALITPSFTGDTGIWRTKTADTLGKGGFSAGVRFFLNQTHNFYNYWKANSDSSIFDSILSLGIGTSEWSEMFFWTTAGKGVFKSDEIGGKSVVYRAGDFNMGLKFSILTESVLGIGFEGVVRMLSSNHGAGFEPNTLSGGGFLIWSFDFKRPYGIPFRFHLNIGYMHDRSQNLIPDSKNDPFYSPSPVEGMSFHEYMLGVIRDPYVAGVFGFDFPTKYLTPFLEYSKEQVIDVDNDGDVAFGWNDSPQRLSFGLKITPRGGLSIDLGAEMAFMNRVHLPDGRKFYTYPPWFVGLGISFTRLPIDTVIIPPKIPPKPPEPPKSTFSLKVVDSETNGGVTAIVDFPDTSLTSLVTDSDGEVDSYEFPVGSTVSVKIRAKGYEEFFTKITVEEAQKKFKIKLKKKIILGYIKGKVTDIDGKPLIAIISFGIPGSPPVATDQNGNFSASLKPGSYILNATAEGYIPFKKSVEIKPDETLEMDIKLLPALIKKK